MDANGAKSTEPWLGRSPYRHALWAGFSARINSPLFGQPCTIEHIGNNEADNTYENYYVNSSSPHNRLRSSRLKELAVKCPPAAGDSE